MLEVPRDMLEVAREEQNFIQNGDEIDIPEIEAALLAAEENCIEDACTLPATQHLQIRVLFPIIFSSL